MAGSDAGTSCGWCGSDAGAGFGGGGPWGAGSGGGQITVGGGVTFDIATKGTYTVTVEDTARRTLTGRVTLTVFGDITAHQFADEILWLAESGITRGCAVAHSYCPTDPVTRAQMASFLARALDLQAPRQQAGFADVDPRSAHAANIEALYAAQITTGCARDPLAYCPSKPVTRAQMASFLARALELEVPPQPAGFDDVDPRSAHAANIEALYAAQMTTGCARDPLAYCPDKPVTRAQMARHVAVFGRSCDIGAMKPDLRPYRWMATQLRIEPDQSAYVGNGSSDELAGARQAGFGYIVHCNIFDRSNGLVAPEEQLRRAGQADTTVDTVDQLDDALALR